MITDVLNINLLEALELQDLPQEQQQELAAKMTEVAEQRLFVESYNRLDEEKAVELDKLMDQDASDAEMYKFLATNIPHFDVMVAEILSTLKSQVIQTYANVKV